MAVFLSVVTGTRAFGQTEHNPPVQWHIIPTVGVTRALIGKSSVLPPRPPIGSDVVVGTYQPAFPDSYWRDAPTVGAVVDVGTPAISAQFQMEYRRYREVVFVVAPVQPPINGIFRNYQTEGNPSPASVVAAVKLRVRVAEIGRVDVGLLGGAERLLSRGKTAGVLGLVIRVPVGRWSMFAEAEVNHYRVSYRQDDDLYRDQQWISRTSVDRESGITGASLRIGLVNVRIKLMPD